MKDKIKYLESLLEAMDDHNDGYTSGIIKAAQHTGGFIVTHDQHELDAIKKSSATPVRVILENRFDYGKYKGPVYLDKETLRVVLIEYMRTLELVKVMDDYIKEHKHMLSIKKRKK